MKNRLLDSAVPPAVCRRGHVLFTLFVFVVLCFCFVCRRPVSCVPNDASFSGLSIFDCPFGIF